MRVGLIGCGRIAERGYVPAFARAEGVQLAAVVDVQSERCRAVAPGVAAFANVGELVASGEVDAVVVATPVGAHVEVAAEAARAGLATLVEKPPARTASEAVGLLELEPAPFVAFNRRFEPGLLSIREQIPSGPIELRLRFHRRGAWGSHGGDDPLLLDVGPHALDLVRWLAGVELTRIRARELADGASIDVELADARGTASVEIRTNSPFLESVEVHSDGRRVARQSHRRSARRRTRPRHSGHAVAARRLAGQSARKLRRQRTRPRLGRGRRRGHGGSRRGAHVGRERRRVATHPDSGRMLAILQLDAISRPIVERMLGEGRLPTLAGLSARGEWRKLQTPATYYTGATHPTLYSGVELGEHSQYYLFQWSPEEQRIRYRRSFDAPELVWERLARSGRRTLAIDPYEGVPPRGPAGVVLSGVQFFNFLGLERWASPRDAGRTVRRFSGRSPYADEVFGEPWLPGLLSLRRRLAQAPGRLGDAAVGLLGERSFDLVWLTFLSTHIGGHQFWDLSQLDEDALDESERALLLSTLPDMYSAVDRQLDRVLRALPEDADLIVVAPAGMGANTSRADFLGRMLTAVLEGTVPAERAASVPLWRLRAAVPTPARGVITRALGPTLARTVMARSSVAGVDWSRTKAFVVPSDHHGQIRLNLRGREREGIVDPSEADELCRQIAEGLLSFRDEDGSQCVVRGRYRREHRGARRARPAAAARPPRPLGRDAVHAASRRRVAEVRPDRTDGQRQRARRRAHRRRVRPPRAGTLAAREAERRRERGRPDGDRVRPARRRHVGARRDAVARARDGLATRARAACT